MTDVFNARNLSKLYGKQTALHPLTMSIKAGEIYGLVGPNGAGKTTLMKLICGLADKSSGAFELFGESKALEGPRSRLGVLVETPEFFPYLTGKENLEYFRRQRGFAGKDLSEQMLALVNLPNDKKKFKGYSLGMKQRLGLALALMNKPEFLILDEPINGIDPEGIVEIRKLLFRLNREHNTTILISSHILTELANLATRFGILHEGHLLQEVSRASLEEKNQSHLGIRCQRHEQALAFLEERFGFSQFSVKEDGTICLFEGFDQVEEICTALVEAGFPLKHLALSHNSLEDYYLSLIGGSAHV